MFVSLLVIYYFSIYAYPSSNFSRKVRIFLMRIILFFKNIYNFYLKKNINNFIVVVEEMLSENSLVSDLFAAVVCCGVIFAFLLLWQVTANCGVDQVSYTLRFYRYRLHLSRDFGLWIRFAQTRCYRHHYLPFFLLSFYLIILTTLSTALKLSLI